MQKQPKAQFWWRTVVCVVCIILGVVAIMGSVATRYLRDNILDTERYVEIVSPLPADPAVALALGTFTAERLFDKTNAEQAIKDFLPPRLAPLASPLASNLQKRTADVGVSVAQSEAFTDAWTTANRKAHEALIKVAEGPRPPKQRATLTVRLDTLLGKVRERLGAEQGFLQSSQRDELAELQVNLQQSADRLRQVVSTINTGAWLFPLLAILFLAGAVVIAQNHRRALLAVGVSMTILAVSSLAAFKFGIQSIENDIATPVYKDAAHVVLEALFGNLHTRLVGLLVVGLIVWFTALLLGPADWAVWVRRRFHPGYQKSRAFVSARHSGKKK